MWVEQPTSSQLDNSGGWGSTREGYVLTVNIPANEKEKETLEMFAVAELNQKSIFFSAGCRELSAKRRGVRRG